MSTGSQSELRGSRAPTGPGRTVTTLLAHGHVEMALTCLGSLVAYSAEPLRLRIHDDGTLTPGDLDRLADLGPVEVVSRARADEVVEEALAHRPHSRCFRRANPLGLKLVDAMVLASGDELAFCDSDVLFLRPFRHLFRLPSPRVGAVFMADRQDAYSVRSWQLLADRRLRLPRRVNTGILTFRQSAYDPDLLEWFLSRTDYHKTPVWVEQTAWALLGQRAGCRLLEPRLVRLALPPEALDPDVVALHFVSPLRRLLPLYHDRAADRQGQPPVSLATVAAGRCRWYHLAASELRRRLGRISGDRQWYRVH